MRLQLFVTGEVHRLLNEVLEAGQREWKRAPGNEPLPMAIGTAALQAMLTAWEVFVSQYTQLVARGMQIGASIPFGTLAIMHEKFIRLNLTQESRRGNGRAFQEQLNPDVVFQPQLDALIQAAYQRTYGDGLNLSNRIWRLDTDTRLGLNSAVNVAIARGLSAWDLAQMVEQYLAVGQDCPRWTRDRLYELTKADIASGDRTGLFTGDECHSQGVSYNALRLARTEIQAIHHTATDALFAKMPWIEQEQINLSPEHAKTDVCDDVVSGGEKGDGVYPKGEISLPLHPHCVTPGQVVETARGRVPIEKVYENDLVLTHSGAFRPVVKAWSRAFEGMVYEFVTDQGHVELTGKHPVLLRRGWVEAKSVKVGDEIMYASVDAGPDLPTSVTKDTPSPLLQEGVTPCIVLGIMPVSPITFDGNLDRQQGEIEKEASYAVFPLVCDSGTVQSLRHSNFNTGRACDSHVFERLEHRLHPRIVLQLGAGDLPSDLWPLGGIVVSGLVSALIDCLEHLACHLTASTVVFLPSYHDGLTSGTEGNPMHLQQRAQDAIGDAISLKNVGGVKALLDVDVVQKLGDWATLFGLQAQAVELGCDQIVSGKMGWGNSSKALATNGARNSHDNLLASSPVYKWGAGPGNPVVDGVANPIQALRNYITIKAIRKRSYSGPVFNLSVLDDNSYIVNGAAVHNCMCYKTAVLMDENTFVNRLRGWMTGGAPWPEMDQYAAMLNGHTTADLRGSEIGVSMAYWLWGDAVNLGVLFWSMIHAL